MSQIYISAVVLILVQLNNMFGLNLGNDELTNAASTIVSLALAAWIAYRRQQVGDINAAGVKKS